MRFIVIGAGGIGGWLIRAIAPTIEYTDKIAVEDKNLIIVDGDVFEPKNATRQDFDMIGPKPTVRCEELAPRYPLVNFAAVNKWVVEKAPEIEEGDEEGEELAATIAASDLIQDGDVIFCVVDNFACRATVTAAAAELENVDLFHAGNDDAYFGSYYHYCRRGGVDVTENPLWKDEFKNPADRNPGEMSCEDRARIDGGTQLIWTNMAVAAMVGIKFNRFIVQDVREPDTDESYFDFEKVKAGGRDRTDADYVEPEEATEEQQADDKVPA